MSAPELTPEMMREIDRVLGVVRLMGSALPDDRYDEWKAAWAQFSDSQTVLGWLAAQRAALAAALAHATEHATEATALRLEREELWRDRHELRLAQAAERAEIARLRAANSMLLDVFRDHIDALPEDIRAKLRA